VVALRAALRRKYDLPGFNSPPVRTKRTVGANHPLDKTESYSAVKEIVDVADVDGSLKANVSSRPSN
jgi:hypothetical protein